jgi:hypothetical protein
MGLLLIWAISAAKIWADARPKKLGTVIFSRRKAEVSVMRFTNRYFAHFRPVFFSVFNDASG